MRRHQIPIALLLATVVLMPLRTEAATTATLVTNSMALGSPGAALDTSAAPLTKTLIYTGGLSSDVVSIEGSLDGTTYAPVISLTGTSRTIQLNANYVKLRSTGAAAATGQLYCNWIFDNSVSGTGDVVLQVNLSATTGGIGTTLDLNGSDVPTFKTFMYTGGQSGDIVSIEVSSDNSHFKQPKGASIAGTKGVVQLPIAVRYVRSHYLAGNSNSGAAKLYLMSSESVLTATGFSGILPIANGGTNAATGSAALTSLGAAASGNNSDITGLSALTSIALPTFHNCTLSGASPAVCTATVTSGAVCVCSIRGATIGLTLACAVSGTTLTANATNGATAVVDASCSK